MFADLKPLLNSCTSVTIVLASAGDDKVNVTILPKAKDGHNASLSTPLALIATLEELDAEFAQVVLGYSAKRLSLAEQLEATETILEAAKAEAVKRAADSKKKKSSPASASASSDIDDDDGDGEGDVEVENDGTPAGNGLPAGSVPAPAAIPVDDLWA